MNVKIASRMAQIRPAATIAVNQKAAALRAQGRSIISLAFGEPDFDTPEHIREAAKRAIDNGETRYPPIAGTPVLNQAIRDKLRRENQLEFGADQVVVTVGAKQAFDSSYGMLAKGGSMVMVGMPASGVMSEIDPGTMAAYSQNILGSKMGSARIQVDIPNLVDLYSQGRVKLDELVTKTYKLEDINEAIDAVKRGDALRNVIVF
ncbi:MAG: aminotransferase class I/II-fold pyridoxal phosphate-dependent enzyme [Candidatus Nanopelagicales bacterium]